MRRLLSFSILFFVSVSVGTIANAAGGGGGGGSPSCTEDTWACGEWGECSNEGKQTRTCTITFDCPNLDTPQPAREQSCTPPKIEPSPTPPPPPPAPTPEPASTPQPASAPTPVAPAAQETNKPSRACDTDAWECDGWSACDPDGNQILQCRKMLDCPGVDTPAPVMARRCAVLQCGNKQTIRERVSCRMNLTPAGLSRELEIEYLPEECRMFAPKSNERIACINLYKAYKPCWQVPVGPGRSECARKILKVDNDTPAQLKNCSGDVRCVKSVKEKVYNAIKFRFYDLEERAEDLLEDGKVSKETVVELTAKVFENKQAFNLAKTKEERRKIILDMREAWKIFVREIKNDKR